MQAREGELKQLQEVEAEKRKIRYLTSKCLCTMDHKCPGFTSMKQPSHHSMLRMWLLGGKLLTNP